MGFIPNSDNTDNMAGVSEDLGACCMNSGRSPGKVGIILRCIPMFGF